MDFNDDKNKATEKLMQENRILKEGLKSFQKKFEETSVLAEGLKSKIIEINQAYSKKIQELDTKIWNYQVKINKYKQNSKCSKNQSQSEDRSTTSSIFCIKNIKLHLENFIVTLKSNLNTYESFKKHVKNMSLFKNLVKNQNYNSILSYVLPFTIELIEKNISKSLKETQAIETNESPLSITKKYKRFNSFDLTDKRVFKNIELEKDKSKLRKILEYQNSQLFCISQEFSNIISKFNYKSSYINSCYNA